MKKKNYFKFILGTGKFFDGIWCLLCAAVLVFGYTISDYVFQLTNQNSVLHILLLLAGMVILIFVLGSCASWWRRERVLSNIYTSLEDDLKYCYKPMIGIDMRLAVLQHPDTISDDVIHFLRFIYANVDDKKDMVISKTITSLKNYHKEFDEDITNLGYLKLLEKLRSLVYTSERYELPKLKLKMKSLEFIKTS